MKNSTLTLITAGAMLAASSLAYAADVQTYEEIPAAGERGGVRIGTLTCDLGGGLGYVFGSAKEVDCTYRGYNGETDSYSGVIRKLGVDLGYTRHGKLAWAVFAPTAGPRTGSLAGRYRGATAEASLIFGAGANVLVGGTTGSVHLQLLSVTGQRGINVAATGTSMTLNAVN